jgi:hypothetical protein
LASILALKSLGVPLDGVRGLLSPTGSGKTRPELLSELKGTIEQSIQPATQTLHCVNAALDELDACRRPIPVVVKHLRAIPVASVRANVKSYTQINADSAI